MELWPFGNFSHNVIMREYSLLKMWKITFMAIGAVRASQPNKRRPPK
jgi:hypothetical protein